MKKKFTFVNLAAILFVLLFVAAMPAVKTFNGTIHYSISTNISPEHPYAGMIPNKAIYSISDEKIRMDVSPTAPGAGAIYLNSKDNTMRMLLDVPGSKFQVIMDEDYQLRQQDDSKIKYLNDTKTIAGYKCHKALITSPVDTTEVWYTTKINVLNGAGMWKNLKGFPLEFTMSQQGVSLSYTATRVEDGNITLADVDVPEGYVPVTMDQLQSMLAASEDYLED